MLMRGDDWSFICVLLTSGVSFAMEVKSIDTICREETVPH